MGDTAHRIIFLIGILLILVLDLYFGIANNYIYAIIGFVTGSYGMWTSWVGYEAQYRE